MNFTQPKMRNQLKLKLAVLVAICLCTNALKAQVNAVDESFQSSTFPPTDWSSNPAPSTDAGKGGFRRSTQYSFDAVGFSAVSLNDGSTLTTPLLSASVNSLRFRYAQNTTATTNSKIVVEYALASAPTVFYRIDSLSTTNFNGTSVATSTWKLFKTSLSPLSIQESFFIRLRDARADVGGISGQSSSSNNYGRYFDSISLSAQQNTFDYRTVASGNFSDVAIWENFNTNTNGWVAADIIPGTTNNVTIRHNVVQNMNYTTGSGYVLNVTAGSYTIAAGKTYISLGATDFGSFPLTIKSDASGTGRIGNSANVTANNLTVERYIPAKATRKWTFVSSPVSGSPSVANSWQQQIFVTGSGTGGTPCGSTNGLGGSTDKYNSNGFDDTQNDPASMFTYTEGNGGSTAWLAIPNTTSVNLTQGVGYRVNVRGDRNASGACAAQINYSGAAPAAGAVTLSSSGSYGTTASTPLSTNYTLLGNPYPCELSFASFRSNNTSKISNKVWIYSGSQANTSDIYSVWNNGQVAGSFALPAEYVIGTTDLIIPSGGAFFVETANNSVGLNVNFFETHKTTNTANGNNLFSRTASSWTDYTRLHLLNSSGAEMDNIIIRFSSDSTVSNTEYGDLDAASFNAANSSVSSLKNDRRLAIQTRLANFTTDTVKLAVGAEAGNYSLMLDEFENFARAQQIILIDQYTNTSRDIKANPGAYNFTITNDPLSQGKDRFQVVFKASTTLPVKFTGISATRKGADVQVSFQTTAEVNVKEYILQTSTNGSNFKSVAGSTIKATNAGVYSSTDVNVSKGVLYYRIQVVDNDGKVSYSNIARVEKLNAAVQYSIYPNPAINELNVTVSQQTKGYTFRILSLSGHVLYTQKVAQSQGVVKIPVTQLPAGVYVTQILTEEGSLFTDKFIRQ
jgi:hypothetical protein